LVVIGVLHASRIDLLVVKNYGDRIQAHYLALAGIEKAKALLYRDARERSRTRQNHSGALYDAADQFQDVTLGRGQFRVFRRGREDEGGGILYGVSDEESRLNINYASMDDLGKMDGMTPDIAAAIVDWRDQDNQVTPGGAEQDYYLSLQPPYLPRNGPIQTIRELLMVRGISRELLLGTDLHQNGRLQPGAESEAVTDAADLGWAGMLTVDSAVDNLDSAGQDRVNIKTADERALTAVQGITSDIAKAIVAYRGQHQFDSIADLLDVTSTQNQGQSSQNASGNQSSQNQPNQGQSSSNSSGAKVISQDLLRDIADGLTVQSDQSLPGVVNINTASLEVLSCLPGVSRELAQAIISFRQSNGFYPNIAWLLRVPGLSQDRFKQLASRVSARSETFRVLSEGRIGSSGTRQRIQEIVHVGLHEVTTVSYREDDL
jgi:competence ComEA-like helix-hairpin-helix protein